MASFIDNILGPLRRSATPGKAQGAPGTAVYGGFIQETDKNPKLVGREKYLTYSEILANTSIVAASVRFFLNLIAKAAWTVQPADDSAEAQRLADLVEDILADMQTPWFRVVRRAAMFRFWGFSIQEWIAKQRDDGVIGLRDIQPRPQVTIERWDVLEDGTVEGVVQRSPQTSAELYLPRTKLIYIVDDSLKDSPEGLGLFRHLAEPAQRLERFEQLEGYNFEMDLRGMPIARAPIHELNQLVAQGVISKEDMQKELDTLLLFMQKHIKNPQLGLMLDSMTYTTTDDKQAPSAQRQWDLEVVNGGSAESGVAVAGAVERLNREMARIMGTEGLLLGGDGRGSLALSRDKNSQFALVVDSTLSELRQSLGDDIITVLWTLNGWPDELKPELRIEQISFQDVEVVTRAILDLAKSGAPLMPNDPAINEVRALLGLSDMPELSEEELALLGPEEEPDDGIEPDEDDDLDTDDVDEDEEE